VAVEDEVNKEQQVATNDKENEQVMVQGTFNDIFVDGTLYIRELTTSERYVLDETNHDITVDFNNMSEEVTTETVVTPIENELKRGGIELVKIEMGSETENRLDGAEYKLVAVDDIKGETEVGRFTTVNGMIHIEDLEYGHYYLEETKAPEGFILDATRIVVELFGNQNHIVKQIFAENEKIPFVKTTLMEQGTNNKEIHAEKTTLVDVVAYKDLIIGQEYTINGQVINKATQEVIATSSVTFVAEQKDGTINVVFEVDASKLQGQDIVAFESLSHNGVEIAVHNDLEDKDQTVKVTKPEVKTTLMEQGTNNKEIHAEKVTLVDTVAYKDLIVGQEYTVNGQVVNKETQEVIATSSVTFVAEQKDGTINVVFEVDASKLQGQDIVAFESLSHNGVEIAVHNDLEDKDQTVKVTKPEVKTTLMEQGTNNKEIHAEKTTLVDVVEYKDLVIGQEYTVNGQVVNKETQEVIATSSVTFVAEQKDGTINVVFEVDASKLQGQDIVAFESLSHNGVEIAVHNDLEDKDQTIKVTKPEVKTTLMEQGTNNKEIHAEKVTLVDTVAYKDLIIGQEYTINGQVVNKETQEVIATSSVTFVAEQKDGTINVVFEVDASKLAGKDIVAFESLSHNGVEIAVHNDLEDKDQTVTVTHPEVKTTLMEQGTNNKEIHAEKTTLVDVVAYKDLIIGQEYTVNGQVVNKETQEVIATSSVTFVTEQKDGTINVMFEVDASELAGKDIVAFESLSHNGVEIAVHNDLEDKDQTITVTHPEVKTTLMEQDTNNKEIHAEKTTLVDVVAYKDLIVGQEYTINGQVVNKETQEVIATSSVTFVAEQKDGTINVVFEVDASELAGKDIVAFESLSHNGVEIAVHNDLEDKDQTVKVTKPEVKTTLMEQGTNNKEIHAEKTTLVDVVAYKDLIVGQEYTINGQVVNKETQEVIATSSVTFVAEQRNGTINVVFEVDTSELAGKDIVAFESLSHNGVEIAVHNDLEDKDQTIKVTKPEVKTTLMEQGTNNKEIHAEKVTLVDTVAYKDLIIGQEYTINGQVVNKETQEVIATSSVTFVAEQKDGTVNVVFEVDASKLQGKDIVAFESLSHNGVEIAVHNDLEDKNQTVKVLQEELPQTSTKSSLAMVSVALLVMLVGITEFLRYKTNRK
ncbi:VaFE repeat-containing surface-anchored protein, partial [Granulicatella balaenopterae]